VIGVDSFAGMVPQVQTNLQFKDETVRFHIGLSRISRSSVDSLC
jgi:hypothetical protein